MLSHFCQILWHGEADSGASPGSGWRGQSFFGFEKYSTVSIASLCHIIALLMVDLGVGMTALRSRAITGAAKTRRSSSRHFLSLEKELLFLVVCPLNIHF